jgi:hypothetical protein
MNLSHAFSNLYESLQIDSSWKPSIFIPSTHFLSTDGSFKVRSSDKTHPHGGQKESIDIVALLWSRSTMEGNRVELTKLGYPADCVFELEGFTGISDYHNVIHLRA